jgi:hypothetical protein
MSAAAPTDAQAAPIAAPRASRVESIAVVAGLTAGWVLGFAGAMLGPGAARETAWAVSSIGIMTAVVVLAARHLPTDVPLAAGLLLLALGEAVIHAQGPEAIDAVAAATYAYVPALLLTAGSQWPPAWTRVTAAGSAIAFAVHAAFYLAGAAPTVDGPAMSIGYGLLGLTMIGWTLRVVDRRFHQAGGVDRR